MRFQVVMEKVRETKNTIRFDSPDPRLPALYIHKSAFGQTGTPAHVRITVTTDVDAGI